MLQEAVPQPLASAVPEHAHAHGAAQPDGGERTGGEIVSAVIDDFNSRDSIRFECFPPSALLCVLGFLIFS